MALAILEKLKERDRATRTIRAGRRIAGKKMTPELARDRSSNSIRPQR